MHSENYKKGLVLQLKSILSATLILLLIIIGMIVRNTLGNFSSRDVVPLLTVFAVFLPIIIHTTLLYSICINNYPDKEINRKHSTIFKIVAAFTWISFGLLALGIAGWIYMLANSEQRRMTLSGNAIAITVLIVYPLLVIAVLIQLILGDKFIARIKKNSASLLLKSFE